MQREWRELSKAEKLLVLEAFEKDIKGETDKMMREINEMFHVQKLPIRLEVEIRMVFDPNNDPRLE